MEVSEEVKVRGASCDSDESKQRDVDSPLLVEIVDKSMPQTPRSGHQAISSAEDESEGNDDLDDAKDAAEQEANMAALSALLPSQIGTLSYSSSLLQT